METYNSEKNEIMRCKLAILKKLNYETNLQFWENNSEVWDVNKQF